MPSLANIFSFATVAFAAFAAAAPTVLDASVIVERNDETAVVDRAVTTDCLVCIAPGVYPLPVILADLQADIKVYVDQLRNIKKEALAVSVIKPIVTGLCAKIDAASTKVLLLVNYPMDKICWNGSIVVSIQVIGRLLSSIVISVLSAVGVVLRLLGHTKGDIYSLLCLVGISISRLLHCVIGVIGGLLGKLLAILCIDLSVVFWVLVKLRIYDLYGILKIDLGLFIGL